MGNFPAKRVFFGGSNIGENGAWLLLGLNQFKIGIFSGIKRFFKMHALHAALITHSARVLLWRKHVILYKNRWNFSQFNYLFV